MNRSFKKGKFKTWYGSGFYRSCLTPNITYRKWLSLQPSKVQNSILGKDKAEIFRTTLKLDKPVLRILSGKLTSEIIPPMHPKCLSGNLVKRHL